MVCNNAQPKKETCMKILYVLYGMLLFFVVIDAQQGGELSGKEGCVFRQKRRELFSQDAQPEEWLYVCHPGVLTVLMPFRMLDCKAQLDRRSMRLLNGPMHMPSEGAIAQVVVHGPLEVEPDQRAVVAQGRDHPLLQLQLEPQDDSFVVILFSIEPPVFLITYHNHTIALTLGENLLKTIVELYEAYVENRISEITATSRGILRHIRERNQHLADNFARNYAQYIPPEIPLPVPTLEVPVHAVAVQALPYRGESRVYSLAAFPFRHPKTTIVAVAVGAYFARRHLAHPLETMELLAQHGAQLLARLGGVALSQQAASAATVQQPDFWSTVALVTRFVWGRNSRY